MIEVSEYLKSGGPNHNEWPWKIIDKSNVEKPAHNDKWCVVGNDKAWVSYFLIYSIKFVCRLCALFKNQLSSEDMALFLQIHQMVTNFREIQANGNSSSKTPVH
jgi:hypothetical protein